MFPNRFATGIRKTTIPNPYEMYKDDPCAKVFCGQVGDYDFKWQRANFAKLQAVLQENGTELGPIVAAEFNGDRGICDDYSPARQIRFVTCSLDGNLMWEKYAAQSSPGNQNDVYVGGKKMHLSTFLCLPTAFQRALLSNNTTIMGLLGIRNSNKNEVRWF